MTEVRYFLDEHLSPTLAEALERLGVTALVPQSAGRRSASDESHLEWAGDADFVIVTRDDDFLGLVHGRQDHAGLVFCPSRHEHSIGEFARLLADVAQQETLESFRGRVRYV